MDAPTPLLSVAETRDGVWSVNERGPSRVAIAYFPSKWGAMKHAVRVDYDQGTDSHPVEV